MAKNWYPVIDILTCGEYLTSFRRLIYCRKAKKAITRRRGIPATNMNCQIT